MKTEDTRQSHYQSYMLRLWREGTTGAWHASLQSTKTEQIYHFVNMDALVDFLLKRPLTQGPLTQDATEETDW